MMHEKMKAPFDGLGFHVRESCDVDSPIKWIMRFVVKSIVDGMIYVTSLSCFNWAILDNKDTFGALDLKENDHIEIIWRQDSTVELWGINESNEKFNFAVKKSID